LRRPPFRPTLRVRTWQERRMISELVLLDLPRGIDNALAATVEEAG
jgi:hypothetical protein